MTDKKKPPPPEDEYSNFKELLGKVAKVPKAEVDEQQREFEKRIAIRKKGVRRATG